MKYIHENIGDAFGVIQEALQKDPSSWEEWFGLHVRLEDMQKRLSLSHYQKEMELLLEASLAGYNGLVLMDGFQSVRILCKDISLPVLKATAARIAQKVHELAGGRTSDEIYALSGGFYRDSEEERNFMTSECLRVLLVEDDPVTRWMVRTALKGECVLMTAGTGGQALDSYHQCKPDLVLLDIHLPDVEGKHVLDGIFESDPRANVVMFSSQDGIENMVSMMEAGASGFISKPFTKERLLRYVRRAGL